MRGDREFGLAESQIPLLWPQEGYDLVINTFKEDTDISAHRILELVKKEKS